MKNPSAVLFFSGLAALAIGIAKSATIYQPFRNLTGENAINLPVQIAIALFVASIAAHIIWGERRV